MHMSAHNAAHGFTKHKNTLMTQAMRLKPYIYRDFSKNSSDIRHKWEGSNLKCGDSTTTWRDQNKELESNYTYSIYIYIRIYIYRYELYGLGLSKHVDDSMIWGWDKFIEYFWRPHQRQIK